MRLMIGTLTALALAVSAPLPAVAQTVGMQVTDASGGLVGTVAGIQGDNLLVKTDKHEVLLPKTSFTLAEGKLLFGLTQAQLNAEIEKNLSAAQAAIVAGATVKGAAGADIGTIESADAETVTIALSSGQKIQVKRAAVRGNPNGSVTLGYTAEQLEAAVAAGSADGAGSK